MIDLQLYLDTFAFIVANTDILMRLGWTFAASIALGAIFLGRFRIWLWIIIVVSFVGLTQWQVDMVLRELGFSKSQIMTPHIITILSGTIFTTGAGIGFYLKERFKLAYTKEPPDVVADAVIKKVNGGDQRNSDSTPVNY